MPKKKTYNFKSLQGSSSSSSKPGGAQNGHETTVSVNERLNDLRKLEAKDAEAKKRQLAESVNQRSVPPDVRGILGFSETAPPKPKANFRMRDRRRTPGPAPPKSWIARSSTSSKPGWEANSSSRSNPKHLLRFARLAGLEDDSIDHKPASLTHLALKSIAESWDLLEEEDYPILAEIPLRLRLRLLSYIPFYNCTLNIVGLQALLQGNESITCLDLAGLIGHRNLSLKRISKLLESTKPSPTSEEIDSIVESWDVAESFGAALTLSPTPNRFSNLTYLCLSHPSPSVSWRDLLALSKLVPQITHLSLAYWPRPTLTPNLSTTTVSSQHSPDITAGGSHYYSTIDQDLTEPASLLRQLSHNLLCLQWLDLEGCEAWTPALGKLASDAQEVVDADGWLTSLHNGPTIFTSNWKNLNHIRCAQGWLPSAEGIKGLGERKEANIIDTIIVEGVLKYLRKSEDAAAVQEQFSDTTLETERKKALLWLDRENMVTFASMRINSSRRTHGLRPIEADFGWTQRHSTTT